MTFDIKDETLRNAAAEGMDAFIGVIADAIRQGVGGDLSAETMPKLTSDQITFLGYMALRDELMDGGCIQLIHNGWGPFFFRNPFSTAIRQWGLIDLCRLVRRIDKDYKRHHEEIEKEMTEDEFMALYERLDVFDDHDDEFVTHEEQWTEMVAHYVDEHLEDFVNVLRK